MRSHENGPTLWKHTAEVALDNKKEIALQLVRTTKELCTRLTEITQSFKVHNVHLKVIKAT